MNVNKKINATLKPIASIISDHTIVFASLVIQVMD